MQLEFQATVHRAPRLNLNYIISFNQNLIFPGALTIYPWFYLETLFGGSLADLFIGFRYPRLLE